jgi:hypothetical protein
MGKRSALQKELKQKKPFRSRNQEAVIAIVRTADILKRQFRVVASYGVTAQQYNVLRILRGAGEKAFCVGADVHAWSALTGTTSSDFSSTAHFYGDSLVQGVKLIGETGRDYSSLLVEAPEPVSGLLVLIGVLLFGTGKLRTWEQKLNFFRMFDAAASTTRLSRCKGTVAVSLLVTLSYVSYGQTGAAPEVMAAGDPPLTRPMAQTICAVMGWLLDIRFNAEPSSRVDFQSPTIFAWSISRAMMRSTIGRTISAFSDMPAIGVSSTWGGFSYTKYDELFFVSGARQTTAQLSRTAGALARERATR